ncbi:MAG: Rrf2 family transcriptional regulator [Myxococcota bacterium]|nr:Rrf2 family transcriptional regulator [Myxococcota bacterium]
MLKLTTRGRYGLRAMIELAKAFGEGPVLMGDIAKRQAFSRKYLHALLTSLKDAGLVMSRRGNGGGYVLAKSPSDILVSEIFEALEGEMAIVDCLIDPNLCERNKICEAQSLWRRLNDTMLSVLRTATLSELVTKKGNLY